MRDILKGIAVIIGLGLALILAVALIHAYGPVKQPLFMTEIDSVMRKHQRLASVEVQGFADAELLGDWYEKNALVPTITAGGIPAAAGGSNRARTVTVCTPGAALAAHNREGEAVAAPAGNQEAAAVGGRVAAAPCTTTLPANMGTGAVGQP